MGGLLNAIDGVTLTEGRIIFMTTNYMERLDPALIRPGRVDSIQFIGHCSNHQLQTMFEKFYPEQTLDKAQLFASEVEKLDCPVSAAQIQGYFMWFKNQPDNAKMHGDLNRKQMLN